MMDTILQLVDRCIALLDKRESVNKVVYAEFIAPLFQDFEVLHRDYLNSFRRYEDTILTSSSSLDLTHPALAQIRKDSIYSHNLRAKISSESVANAYSGKDPNISELISEIYKYLNFGCQDFLEGDFEIEGINGPRQKLRKGLCGIFEKKELEEVKQRKALDALDRIVVSLQEGYYRVLYCEKKIKRQFLRVH